jgi:hypothetical protein
MNCQLPTTNCQRRSRIAKAAMIAKAAKRSRLILLTFACFAFFATFAVETTAQQLLDRVVARVGTSAITQTDVDAALAMGVIDRTGDPVKQMIDRRLMLAEVVRFPPPEPTETAVNELVATMKAAAGAQLTQVMKRTGVDEKRLVEIARDTLRIQAYVAQRFGGPRSDQQRAQWLESLRTRGDVTEFTLRQ